MKEEIKKIVEEWVKEANEDLEVAKKLLDDFPKKSAFHAQQAVEKFLKAFLAKNNKKIPKIHEIEVLISLCSEIDKEFEKLYEIKAYELSKYYKTRYPPVFFEITKQEAQEAIKIAEKVKEFVLKKI